MTLASRNNAAIRRIRALSSRRERDRTGVFFVEGAHLLLEATQTRAAIDILVAAPPLLRGAAVEILESQRGRGVPVVEVSPEVFLSLSAKEGRHGLGAVVRQRWETLSRIEVTPASRWIALEEIAYPSNLGTILRTGDAVGASGVLLIGPTTDPYDPLAVRASMGAVFSQGLVRATPAEFAAWVRTQGCSVVGASPTAAADYRSVRCQLPAIVLLGSERHGLSPTLRSLCDSVVRVPMAGRCDSLNVAVSAGIVLYEMFGPLETCPTGPPTGFPARRVVREDGPV